MPSKRRLLNLNRLAWALFVVPWLLFYVEAVAQGEEPQATPYRPTVSNPAQLSVPGYLEVELGWQSLKNKATDDRRHSVPYLLKFALTDRVGLLLGGEAVVMNDQERGATLAGFGTLTPLLKFHFPLPPETASAIGLEMGATFPTAPSTVGRQQTDYLVTGIYSLGIGPMGVDLNLGYTRLGGTPSGTGKDQVFWATSMAFTLTPRWSVAGEFAGTARQDVKPFTQFLASTSYVITPRVVADTGMAFGLNGSSQEWTAFAGLTVLVGKVL